MHHIYFTTKSPVSITSENILVLFIINNMNYFTPLSSYKPKHDKMKNCLDFLKIGNYAVININNMFPVPEGEYQYVHIPEIKNTQYQKLLMAEYRLIKKLQDRIKKNALELYKHKLTNGTSTALSKRCNDFLLLEEKCCSYLQSKK